MKNCHNIEVLFTVGVPIYINTLSKTGVKVVRLDDFNLCRDYYLRPRKLITNIAHPFLFSDIILDKNYHQHASRVVILSATDKFYLEDNFILLKDPLYLSNLIRANLDNLECYSNIKHKVHLNTPLEIKVKVIYNGVEVCKRYYILEVGFVIDEPGESNQLDRFRDIWWSVFDCQENLNYVQRDNSFDDCIHPKDGYQGKNGIGLMSKWMNNLISKDISASVCLAVSNLNPIVNYNNTEILLTNNLTYGGF
jgi:hypothetical protein